MPPRYRPTPAAITAAAVAALALAVYWLTAARHVYWGDGSEFAAVASVLGIAHPPGYPLYTLVTSLAVRVPGGSPAFRLGLLSGLFGAAAAALASLLAWRVAGLVVGGTRSTPGRILGAAVAGAAFALAPTVWSQATVPEVYTLLCALIFATLLALVARLDALADRGRAPAHRRLAGRRLLLLAGFLFGLAVSHHLTAALLVPSIAVALFAFPGRRPSVRGLAGFVAFAALGFSTYLYLPIRSARDPAVLWASVGTLRDFFAHITGSQYAGRLFADPLIQVMRRLGRFVVGLPGELTWAALALAVFGFLRLARRSIAVFLVLALEGVLVVAHAVNYRIPDVVTYYPPAYGMLAIAAGVGAAAVAAAVARRSRAIRGGLVVALGVVLAASFVRHARADWSERNLRALDGARQYATELLDLVPPSGIVLGEDDRTVFLLWYDLFAQHRRDDVAVISLRERAPHLEKWFPWVTFPSEEKLAVYFGRDPAEPCVPPALKTLPVARYAPYLVQLNEGRLPVFADIDFATDVMPDRAVPDGLLVAIVQDSASAPAGAAERNRILWDEYRSGLGSPVRADLPTRMAYAAALGHLGQLYLAQHKTDDAIAALEGARDLAPDAPSHHNNLGVAYREAGRLDDAIREFREALKLEPGLAAAHYNIHYIYLAGGDAAGAEKALKAAVHYDPTNLRYQLDLASLYEQAGDTTRAESIYSKAGAHAGDDWAAAVAYGDFLLRRRRYSEAVAVFREAEKLNPRAADVQTGISQCYWEMHDLDRAIEAMRRSVELQPHNPKLRYDLAVMLSRAGHLEEAVVLLDDVIRVLPEAWEPRALKGTILARMGHTGQASAVFRQAHEIAGDDPGFLRAWSNMETIAGDTARARAILKGLPPG
jgi:tetratricopeptide (TPR) repeat protein